MDVLGLSYNSGTWTMSFRSISINPLSPSCCPPEEEEEGLVKIDLTIKRLYLQRYPPFGNPRIEYERVPTFELPGTMSRTDYSSTIHHWIQSVLEEEEEVDEGVFNRFTDMVIHHVLPRNHDDRKVNLIHVEAELDYTTVDLEEEEEVLYVFNKGLSTRRINLLRDVYVFLAAEEEEQGLGDEECSICLDNLVIVSAAAAGDEDQDQEKNKNNNYLFKSPCGHVFHDECITEWLSNNDSCPLCRFVVSSDLDAKSGGVASISQS